jgi:hypothetical protein
VSISATSNTVSVKNAENGGDGKSLSSAALFGYSNRLGADQLLSAGETTATKTLEFNDPASEMFNFYVQVTAFENGAGATSAPGGAAPSSPAAGGGSTSPTGSLPKLTGLLRITANPLTKTVTAQLVR